MELELGLAPPNHAGSCGKRGSAEAFRVNKPTLPLFLRDHDDDGGDHDSGEDGTGQARDPEMGNKRKRLVGWPPVKSAHRPRGNGGGGHVKVKMEGVPIGRKADLSRHASYEELHDTLHFMFPSSADQDAREGPDRHGCRHGHAHYAVIYEDGDGDWMLVGDVPWEDFARSAKRLKILM